MCHNVACYCLFIVTARETVKENSTRGEIRKHFKVYSVERNANNRPRYETIERNAKDVFFRKHLTFHTY